MSNDVQDLKRALLGGAIKFQGTIVAATLGLCALYATSINLGAQPINRADIAFLLLVGVVAWLVYKNHWWMKKGYLTFQVMKAQHEASQALINAIMRQIPEENHEKVLEGIMGEGIAQVVNVIAEAQLKRRAETEGQQSPPPSD